MSTKQHKHMRTVIIPEMGETIKKSDAERIIREIKQATGYTDSKKPTSPTKFHLIVKHA